LRTYLSLLALVVCVSSSQVASSLPTESPSQALIHLVESFSQAQRTFDVAALASLTTDDYVEVSPLGEVDPREKMLGFYAPEHKVDAPEMVIEDTRVRVYGDTGVVLAKLSYSMKGIDEQRHTSELRGTFVARKTPDGWKLASSSFTPIRPQKAK